MSVNKKDLGIDNIWVLPTLTEPPSVKRWREQIRENERKIAEAEAKSAKSAAAKSRKRA